MLCLWKIYNWYSFFRFWTNIIFPFVKNFRRNFENSLICIQKNISTDRNFFFWRKNFLLSFSDLERTFWSFVERLYAKLWKLHALCPNDYVCGIFFLKKKYPFISRRTLSETFGLLTKNYRWGCGKCNLHIHSNRQMKIVFFVNKFKCSKHF